MYRTIPDNMQTEEQEMKKLIDTTAFKEIEARLSSQPALANQGIRYDDQNTTKAHPLHRICDGVFSGTYTEEAAIEMAKIFLKYGANINGGELKEKEDSPLTAASSLHADELAIFYMNQGADIHHVGCHGGTALHWACWCGRSKVVEQLLKRGAAIDQRCIDFKATPLFWAIHGLKNGGYKSMDQCLECVKLLLQSGADKSIPNIDGHSVYDLLSDEDVALKELLGT